MRKMCYNYNRCDGIEATGFYADKEYVISKLGLV